MSDTTIDLSKLDLLHRYKRTATQSLMQEFMVPCLKESVNYDRIAGYFSASTLVGASAGFNQFINNENARYRLIVGAKLLEDEEEVVFSSEQACDTKAVEDSVNAAIDTILRQGISSHSRDRLRNLSFLLNEGILEMKVAVRVKVPSGDPLAHSVAEFHEKVGIFSDGNHSVSFTGSVNESMRGWTKNQESIDVFCSWWGDSDKIRVESHRDDFEAYWNTEGADISLGVAVHKLPSESARKLIENFPPVPPREFEQWTEPNEEESLWIHQDEAIEWYCKGQASGIGIFEMATGSGKTRTAMRCMKKMLEMSTIERVIIAVPNSLLNQWRKELTTFLGTGGPKGIIKSLYEYSGRKKEHLAFKRAGPGAFLLVSHTMLLELLNNSKHWKKSVLDNTLCVVDEMHNVGSDRFRTNISEDGDEIVELEQEEASFRLFGCRLGLSATPWSQFDEENNRNKFLVRNFTRFPIDKGNLFEDEGWKEKLKTEGYVFDFGLEDGIRRGILAEFDYMCLEYEPTQKEKEEYSRLVRGAYVKDESGRVNPLGAIRAASVFKGSRNKIPVFKQWLEKNPKLDRTLIFVEDTEFGVELMENLNTMGYSNFTKFFMGDEKWNLDSFANGSTNYLVSCHRISEGIDIQSVNQIILFSSATTRLETIQRIGRALRKGDQPKRSVIVDFIYDKLDSDLSRAEWLTELSKERNQK